MPLNTVLLCVWFNITSVVCSSSNSPYISSFPKFYTTGWSRAFSGVVFILFWLFCLLPWLVHRLCTVVRHLFMPVCPRPYCVPSPNHHAVLLYHCGCISFSYIFIQIPFSFMPSYLHSPYTILHSCPIYSISDIYLCYVGIHFSRPSKYLPILVVTVTS